MFGNYFLLSPFRAPNSEHCVQPFALACAMRARKLGKATRCIVRTRALRAETRIDHRSPLTTDKKRPDVGGSQISMILKCFVHTSLPFRTLKISIKERTGTTPAQQAQDHRTTPSHNNLKLVLKVQHSNQTLN